MILSADSDVECEPDSLRHLSDEQKTRLTELLDVYLRRLEQGESVDIDGMLSGNPDLAEAIGEYLAKLNALYGISQNIRSTEQSGEAAPSVLGDSMTLGDFKILRELGRGGMGIVYEARQVSVGRKVAVKVLPMASLLDSRQVARFRNEAHAAGLLQHPHIVPVYSVGFERGIHYFAMQLIDGDPIDVWESDCRARRESATPLESRSRTAPSGRNGDNWRRIVSWGSDVADALHSAHETGVIHRDIKPSNLILDRGGKIWVSDFGLARCQSDLSLTMTGDVVGTVRYMSPEQASGKSEAVDHRTDIYSLAATLFEMLTLEAAVPGEDGTEILRAVKDDPPPRLRRLMPEAPYDLDVVLQKAMAKRRDDRYESAKQFRDDLLAILEGRPTFARPMPLTSKLGRWVAKRQKAVTAVAALMCIAMVWLVISSAMILKKNREAEQNAARANRYLHQAQSTVDRLGTRVAEQLAAVPGAEHVRQSLLQETLGYYSQFVAAAGGDPSFDVERAATHSRIGSVVKVLQSPRDAIPHLMTAAAEFDRLESGKGASLEIKQAAAQNLNQLGLALADDNRGEEALGVYSRALSLQREIVESNPADLRAATELALTMNNVGSLLHSQGNRDRAYEQLEAATAELSRIVRLDPNNELASRGLAAGSANLGSLLVDSQASRAAELLRQALEYRLASTADSANPLSASAEIASLYNAIGTACFRAGDLPGAEQAYEDAVRLQRQLHLITPAAMSHANGLAIALNNLATVSQANGRSLNAAAAAGEAIQLQQRLLAEGGSDAEGTRRLAAMQHNLASALLAQGRIGPARETILKAIEQERAILKEAPDSQEGRTQLTQHFSCLLRCEVKDGRWDEAVAVAAEYRRSAAVNAETLLRAARDMAGAILLIPEGEARGSFVAVVVETLTAAKSAGAVVDRAVLADEPFDSLASEPALLALVSR